MEGGLSKGYGERVFLCPEVNGASLTREVCEYNLKIDLVTAGVKLATLKNRGFFLPWGGLLN